MLAFTKFSEDPNAHHATVMLDPSQIESCSIGESKIAYGGREQTITIVMRTGTTHVVYGGMKDYMKIEESISFEPPEADVSGFEVSDFLAKEIAWHEQNKDKALTEEYQKGFINGLIHARQTVSEMQSAMGIETEE